MLRPHSSRGRCGTPASGWTSDAVAGLFQEFQQADGSISRRFGGTGLGLAISKRLAALMGGDIQVTSEPGKGSVFRFDLRLPITSPRVTSNDDETALYQDFSAALGALGRPLRVLVVDDRSINCVVVTKMLAPYTIDISTAGGGAGAISAAARSPFDVILMDMSMPEIDGLEATRRIRALGEGLATITIIALTANAYADDVKACKDAGMNDFLAKPTQKKQLVAAIMRVVERISGDRPTHAALERARGAPSATPKPAPGGAEPLFDRRVAAEIARDIGQQGLSEGINLLIDAVAEHLSLLRRASIATDREAIKRCAHSLKGEAATYGFIRLSKLARELENAAMTISEDEYRLGVDAIEAAFEETCAEARAAEAA